MSATSAFSASTSTARSSTRSPWAAAPTTTPPSARSSARRSPTTMWSMRSTASSPPTWSSAATASGSTTPSRASARRPSRRSSMPLLKDGKVAADSWAPLAEGAEMPQGDVIVTLEQWLAGRERLRGHNGRLGLRLKSDQSPAQLADDLQHFALIALEFPRFGDGRAYSYARLLRERYAFEGELRAVGNVLRDQLLFMLRCGFDA